MRLIHVTLPRIAAAIGMAMFLNNHQVYAQAAPEVPPEELPAGSEVLTRGPVHEAFAKPVTMDPQAPILIAKRPPDPIQEMPPAEKPAGANIVWVPGYWAWDEDRQDFIWVSGCWRNAPPNTYWVPGHWLQLDTGWEWIAGFWRPIAAQAQQEIEYLPAPPAAAEIEAPGPPPIAEQIWVPGCWYWVQGRYVQRHGYWVTPHIGWVWVPSHYVWSPLGYIFCGGHWDHDLDNRGVLFTPTYFPPAVRVRAGFVFCPGVCVDLGVFRLNLFVYPRYHHYCFGDYYDASYQRFGIYPWFKCQTIHTWYDPLFVHDHWQYGRTDHDWAKHQAQEFQRLQANRDLRPARTYEQLKVQIARMPESKRPEHPLAEPVKVYAAAQTTPVKFEKISTTERQQLALKTKDVHDFRNQRTEWESPARKPAASSPPVVHQESRPDNKPAPAPSAKSPTGEQPRKTPDNEPARSSPTPTAKPPSHEPSKAPAIAPARSAPEVSVTQPHRQVVPSPLPIAPKPSESRYIEKTSPSHPPSETYRPGASPNAKSQDKSSRGKDQQDNPGKDRPR